jgi:hypothetical protein
MVNSKIPLEKNSPYVPLVKLSGFCQEFFYEEISAGVCLG